MTKKELLENFRKELTVQYAIDGILPQPKGNLENMVEGDLARISEAYDVGFIDGQELDVHFGVEDEIDKKDYDLGYETGYTERGGVESAMKKTHYEAGKMVARSQLRKEIEKMPTTFKEKESDHYDMGYAQALKDVINTL